MNRRRSLLNIPWVWRSLTRETEEIFKRYIDPFPRAQINWLGEKGFRLFEVLWPALTIGLSVILTIRVFGVYFGENVGLIKNFFVEFFYSFFPFAR